MLPGVSHIRRSHTPGANLPAPVSKPRSCVSRARPRIPIEQLPLFFFKAKPATARALLFSCPSLRVCSDAPVHFFAQPAQVFLFFPTSALRCPSSGRTKGRFSKKPPDKSEKRGAIGENTEAFSRLLRSFSPFPTQTRDASPGVYRITRCKGTSSLDFMHKLLCFLPFSVRRLNMDGHIPFTFLHSFSSIPQQSIFHAQLITTISKFTTQNTHM